MKVIALRGEADTGKTETLNIVYQLLLSSGYKQIKNHFEVLGNPIIRDFLDILENDETKIKIGFATMGDYARNSKKYPCRNVKCLLKKLEDKGCDIVICACRESIKATVDAVKKYKNIIVDKTVTVDEEIERLVNNADANKIYSIVI